MDTHGRGAILGSTKPTSTCRRIIMFPLPYQGHINPMLQLASILHTHGFEITIIHTELNSANHLNYPRFTFKSIKDSFSEMIHEMPTNPLLYLNRSCVDSFKDCLAKLLKESDKEHVACLISDAGFYFTQAVADELNLPRMVLQTNSLGSVVSYSVLPYSSKTGGFYATKDDPGCESSVAYPLLKVKDLAKISTNPQISGDIVAIILKQMKASEGLIWNTFKELEEPELEKVCHDLAVRSFTLGPFHRYISASSSSLIEQDRTIISWLDNQTPKSTIYISFGSDISLISKSEFQEVAEGLVNVGLPFLWVVRPGLVIGSIWLEALPENFLERVGDRGQIVKWCPQQEVLAHPAIGCFWTHNGWNSTLESICEGVPMVCSPRRFYQPVNARYVSDVWKIGVFLENGFERGEIETAIKSIMSGKEGEEMRKRSSNLKEKVNHSLDKGGSSHQSLLSLVDYISSL